MSHTCRSTCKPRKLGQPIEIFQLQNVQYIDNIIEKVYSVCVPSSLLQWCDLSLKVGVVYTDEDGWSGRVQLGDHLRRQEQL